MLLAKIPWSQIIKYSPYIVRTSREIYDNVRDYIAKRGKRPGEQLSEGEQSELEKRVVALERNELAQADLINKLAEQNQNLVETLRILSIRLNYALGLSLIALLLSIIVAIVKLS